MPISTIVDSVVEINKRNGFTLGFHMSKFDIKPEHKGWVIAGYELDDRDNLPMAYYSLDYTNAFRKRDPNFIYVVRADTKSDTHKKDLTNNWGRASSLSIIAKLDVADIDKEVEQRLTENTNETDGEEYKIAA
ncbi:MAG: hypothetical protein RI996_644 [Candidatus Parcubacteria bacterium]|jgi:hypothetical protein